MAKQTWKPGNMLYPVPAVMVSCQREGGKPNIITVAWAGTICSDPAMLSISVRKNRYSYDIIKETKEFVVNLTTKQLCRATDYCGVRSGRDVDKFQEMHLTPQPSEKVKAPGIAESPVNIECRVTQVLELGTHDMFLAEVVAVRVDDGTFGYSVAKNKPQSIAGNNPKHKSKSSTKKGVKAKGRSGKHTRKEKGKK